MRLVFKQALLIDGLTYPVGENEVLDDKLKHPHFDMYMKAGIVARSTKAAQPKPEGLFQRAERLAKDALTPKKMPDVPKEGEKSKKGK